MKQSVPDRKRIVEGRPELAIINIQAAETHPIC